MTNQLVQTHPVDKRIEDRARSQSSQYEFFAVDLEVGQANPLPVENHYAAIMKRLHCVTVDYKEDRCRNYGLYCLQLAFDFMERTNIVGMVPKSRFEYMNYGVDFLLHAPQDKVTLQALEKRGVWLIGQLVAKRPEMLADEHGLTESQIKLLSDKLERIGLRLGSRLLGWKDPATTIANSKGRC